MPNYNKNKGKSLEREVAKHLTEVFGLNFERVWSSGAFTGGQNAFRLQKLTKEQALLSAGDILVPMELEHVLFECKFYKAFSFHAMFENNETLNGWIEQASAIPTKYWFLIFKINNVGKFVVFDSTHEALFKPIENRMIYKNKYLVCKYDGFFEENKEVLLSLKTCPLQQPPTTITQ
jgi:Holliday junction resolvase